ncbi:MAG: hypothetical protein AAFW76_11855, partial [Pseudomonadota bacterium]
MDLGEIWRRADKNWVRETALSLFFACWALVTLMHVAALAQSAGRDIFAILPWAIWNGLKYAVPITLIGAAGMVL